MGLKVFNTLIKTATKSKLQYVAPKVEVRTLESFGKNQKKIGDILEFSNNPIEYINKNASKNNLSLKEKIFNKLYYFYLKSISPGGNFEILRAIEPRNFKKIKLLKNLSEEEISLLGSALKHGDEPTFFATITGNKPACIIGGHGENLSFLEKLKSNTLFSKDFDMLTLGKSGDKSPLVYIFNRQKVLETIQNNKNLYISRLELPKETSVNEIYSKLIDNGQQYFNCTTNGAFQDLTGITLGFPRLSSMMFQLEKLLKISNLREKEDLYKKLLLEALGSEKSPYKNLPKDEFNMLKQAIENYKYKKKASFKNPFYQFVELANEPKEIQRIRNEVENFHHEFSFDNLL